MKKIAFNNLFRKEDFIYCILLSLILVLLYFPGMNYPFMLQWDDGIFITENPSLAFTFENLKLYFSKPFQDLYTPLTMVSLMLDHALFGFSQMGYHIHNLLLHILCTIFFFFILRKFKIRSFLAFSGALLWALNPQKIESVIWITERKDVLSGFLFAASFYFFLDSTEKKKIPFFSTILAILALLTKPSAIPLPGVMAVYLFVVWGKRHSFKEYLHILLLPLTASFAVILLSAHITAQTFPGVFQWRIPLWIHNIFWYPLTAVFPQVHPFYPLYLDNFQPYIPIYIAGTAAIFALIFWAKKVGVTPQKTLGFFLVTGGLMVPVLGVIVYTYYDHADRYNYLVSMGVWAFLAFLLERTVRKYPRREKYLRTVLIVTGTIYFVLSWLYLPYWEKCEYLFARCLEDTRPSNVMFYDNGAVAAYASGNHKLLQAISDKMLRDHKAYTDSEAQYFSGLAYGLHASILRKDHNGALFYYQKLESMYKTKGGLKLDYWPYFFHNMAVTAAQNGSYRKAEGFLKIFFKLHNRKKHSPIIYYNALALQAQIYRKDEMLFSILKTMKKYDPNLSFFTPIKGEVKEK